MDATGGTRAWRREVDCSLNVTGVGEIGSVGRDSPDPNFFAALRAAGSVGRAVPARIFRRAARGLGRSVGPSRPEFFAALRAHMANLEYIMGERWGRNPRL